MDELGKNIVEWCVLLVRAFLTLGRPLSEAIVTAYLRIFFGKANLPPIKDPILLMPAVKLAEKIRKKQLTSEEVVRAYINRARDVQPQINAIVDSRYEEAIQEAKVVDKLIASGEKSEEQISRETPFLGVPFTVKECIGVKGLYQTTGIVARKGIRAEKDPDVVHFYRKAGAIPFCVTNTPELCMWWESANHIYGFTKNPYDFTRTVGGSSGGEGALITAGGAVMGIGNDIAGSIRIPASFCGIYGHKPSSGVISNKGSNPEVENELDRYISTGPMCRYVEDLYPITRVAAGNDSRVQWDAKIDFRNINFYYMEGYSGFLTPDVPEIKRAVLKAARYFQETYGSKVEKIDFKEMENAFSIWECKLLEANPPPFKEYMEQGGPKLNLYWELLKNLLRCSEHTIPALYFGIVDKRTKDKVYYKALADFLALEAKFKALFEDGRSVFLFPTHPEPPPHNHTTIFKYSNIGYTAVFNILGFPSTQIPAGLCNHLPIGIQAISGPFQDQLTLAVALELDKLFKGWISPVAIEA